MVSLLPTGFAHGSERQEHVADLHDWRPRPSHITPLNRETIKLTSYDPAFYPGTACQEWCAGEVKVLRWGAHDAASTRSQEPFTVEASPCDTHVSDPMWHEPR